MVVKSMIKKGDTVIVITGRDKGKTGEVINVNPKIGRVIVRGVNIYKKHEKPTQNSPGGIKEEEKTIHLSNIALIDPKDNKAGRIRKKILDDGRKVRVSNRSGESYDG